MGLRVQGLCPLLGVYDMPASIAFYCGVLGFEVVTTSPPLPPPYLYHWALLRLGDAELMLNTAYETNDERPPVRDPQSTAAHGDTCLYLACPDVDEAFRTLRAKGVAVTEPRVAPYGMKQISLADPDGFLLCLQWPA